MRGNEWGPVPGPCSEQEEPRPWGEAGDACRERGGLGAATGAGGIWHRVLQARESRDLLLPGSWDGQPQPSEVAMGHENVFEGLWGCDQPGASLRDRRGDMDRGWQQDLILSLLPSLCSFPGRAGQGAGSPPEPPKGPRAPSSTSALPRTLPRARQRDAKSHHANYANRINYSCYSEGSPESSLAL